MENTLTENKIIIDSNNECISLATKYIDSIYSSFEEDIQDTYGNVIIAVTEAVNNASFHGNKFDSTKKVSLSFKEENNFIVFTVEDEGKGFDYENVPDPTDPKNSKHAIGRGVFLMKNLTDEINFLENGSKIELIFKIK